ncbi:hypothetical protein CPT34_13800 [Rhizobium sophoriradicis]|uniref:Uncharacterized protein n=1 Tax=Rhizobium sophoriradicis TaxID=1535245 RepID=A0A2A5KTL6_9HYPH|nr:hypothetical protein CPT34_13800 [Rhizobium sophoriradicis]PCK83452.1 hypothetical protein CPT32_29200 [Rhizobium sophoriradicis]
MLFNIRPPFARPTIMRINLRLTTASGMAVVAGIAGSGRLEGMFCGAIRTVDIATSIMQQSPSCY